MPAAAPSPSSPLLVACLCARWCRTCDAYGEVFASLAAHFGGRVQAVWIDIEDQADVVDGVDVDDFPTVLIARRGDDNGGAAPCCCFFGPVLPHLATVTRLVQTALAGELPPVKDGDGRLAALCGRAWALPASFPLTRQAPV